MEGGEGCGLFCSPKLPDRAFSLTWPASMLIYWNKRKQLHEKRVQLPQDFLGTPTWPPFHCFGTPIWPPWRHVKTLYLRTTIVTELNIKTLFQSNDLRFDRKFHSKDLWEDWNNYYLHLLKRVKIQTIFHLGGCFFWASIKEFISKSTLFWLAYVTLYSGVTKYGRLLVHSYTILLNRFIFIVG